MREMKGKEKWRKKRKIYETNGGKKRKRNEKILKEEKDIRDKMERREKME